MRESRPKSVIQPNKLAAKEGELRFSWLVKDFDRLSSMLFDDSGKIKVFIKGFFDANKRCLLETQIEAELVLECQTSFTPVTYLVEKEVTFTPVASESLFAEVEGEFEPVLLEDGFLDMQQVIQDELILSLPLVVNKSPGELEQKMTFGKLDQSVIDDEAKKKNPFAVLSELKNSDSQKLE